MDQVTPTPKAPLKGLSQGPVLETLPVEQTDQPVPLRGDFSATAMETTEAEWGDATPLTHQDDLGIQENQDCGPVDPPVQGSDLHNKVLALLKDRRGQGHHLALVTIKFPLTEVKVEAKKAPPVRKRTPKRPATPEDEDEAEEEIPVAPAPKSKQGVLKPVKRKVDKQARSIDEGTPSGPHKKGIKLLQIPLTLLVSNYDNRGEDPVRLSDKPLQVRTNVLVMNDIGLKRSKPKRKTEIGTALANITQYVEEGQMNDTFRTWFEMGKVNTTSPHLMETQSSPQNSVFKTSRTTLEKLLKCIEQEQKLLTVGKPWDLTGLKAMVNNVAPDLSDEL